MAALDLGTVATVISVRTPGMLDRIKAAMEITSFYNFLHDQGDLQPYLRRSLAFESPV